MARGILITGASSGLGEGLALAYAAPGATLFLSGRDETRLEAVAEQCRALGAQAVSRRIDVSDPAAMADWVEFSEKTCPLDLVIANAGISAEQTRDDVETMARAIFATNIDGILNTVLPALPLMRARRHGQIALVSSLASFRGLATAPAYCASKAAVRVWGEGMRPRLAEHGIGLTVICPGFVKSRMTAESRFPMPFLMETGDAVQVMKRGIDNNRARVAFPGPMAAGAWLLAALPPAWTDGILTRSARPR